MLDILDEKMRVAVDTKAGRFVFERLSPRQSVEVSAEMHKIAKQYGFSGLPEFRDADPATAAQTELVLGWDKGLVEKPTGFTSWMDNKDPELFDQVLTGWQKQNQLFREETGEAS